MWARALGRLAGVRVPLVAMHHAYVVTERIEGIQVSPEQLHLGSSALGDRVGEAERSLSLPQQPQTCGTSSFLPGQALLSGECTPSAGLSDHPQQSQI